MKIRVPVQPFIDYIKRTGTLASFFEQEEFEDKQGKVRLQVKAESWPTYERHSKRLERAVRQGWIDYFQADELCIDVFGVHPAQIFGAAWWNLPNDTALQDRLAGRTTKKEAA